MSAVGRQLEIGWTGAFEAFRPTADVVGGLASRAFREGCSLVLRTQTTSRDRRSLRSAGGQLDGMDFMDGMDSEPRALQLQGVVVAELSACAVLGASRTRVLRTQATSRGRRSLRSAGGHLDRMDFMDGVDSERLHLRRTGGVHRMLRGDGLLRVDRLEAAGHVTRLDARFARRAVTWTRWTRMGRDGHGWTRWTRTAKRCTCGGRAACIGCSGATASCGSMAGVVQGDPVTRLDARFARRAVNWNGMDFMDGMDPNREALHLQRVVVAELERSARRVPSASRTLVLRTRATSRG